MIENRKVVEAFTKTLPDYLRDVENISGKLFYSITWHQISEHLDKHKPLRILDVGCGFGLTSIWLSEQGHDVTGIDITPDMIHTANQKAKEKKQTITFMQGEIENIDHLLQGKTFDWIICHNVLGYVDQPVEALKKLFSMLNPGGYLSLIAHNPAAKVLRKAIVDLNMAVAKEMIYQDEEFNPLIGAYVKQYSVETYLNWFKEIGAQFIQYYGVRSVYDYLQSEEQSEPQHELEDLLSFELALGKLDPYRNISFFTHYILQK